MFSNYMIEEDFYFGFSFLICLEMGACSAEAELDVIFNSDHRFITTKKKNFKPIITNTIM